MTRIQSPATAVLDAQRNAAALRVEKGQEAGVITIPGAIEPRWRYAAGCEVETCSHGSSRRSVFARSTQEVGDV
jgi:hypothetical protein